MSHKRKALLLPLILPLILSIHCGGKPDREAAAQLPHLRYFECAAEDDGKTVSTLYDFDLNTLAKNKIWSLADYNIDRIELTPDGCYVLVHYSIYEKLSQYYAVYDLNSREPGIAMTFTRDDEETRKISAYQAFLDDGVYKLGFIIGDADFEALAAGERADVYQFAWVNLAAAIVEEIPLTTTMDMIPDITFVPIGGGFFDLLPKDAAQIERFEWDTLQSETKAVFFDSYKEPSRRVDYIGSFSYFADFAMPPRTRAKGEGVQAGIRTLKDIVPLEQGDYPLWSLGDRYILLRAFAADEMERMSAGEDPVDVLMYIAEKGESAKFAVYDINAGERRDISLEMKNPMSMPHPIFDSHSSLLAAKETGWVPIDADTTVDEPDTCTIIVYDVAADKTAAMIEGVPDIVTTSIAFYRPQES